MNSIYNNTVKSKNDQSTSDAWKGLVESLIAKGIEPKEILNLVKGKYSSIWTSTINDYILLQTGSRSMRKIQTCYICGREGRGLLSIGKGVYRHKGGACERKTLQNAITKYIPNSKLLLEKVISKKRGRPKK